MGHSITVTCDPETHVYKDNLGRKYKSVTTLLNEESPFDRVKIATICSQNKRSKYYGMMITQILNMWSEAASQGTDLHKATENYIKTKEMLPDSKYRILIEKFSKLRFNGKILSESLVWDERYLLAGTVDIFEDIGNHIWLWDIKTCNNMTSDKIEKYSKQLEIYKRLGERILNKPIKIGGLIWFEDFIKQGDKTNIHLVKTLNVADKVDIILEKRKREISQEKTCILTEVL